VRFAPHRRVLPALCGAVLLLGGLGQPAVATGIEDGVKAMQSGDMPAAEKALQLLAKERDPRAQFLLGFYVYGNPDSKLYDMNKATPLLLDAAERGYTPAMIPLAGAYADGKGVPKSYSEAYKWLAIAEHWNAPNADALLIQVAHELKPDEIEHAKAAAAAFAFKTK
jgi:TPR repeat protein